MNGTPASLVIVAGPPGAGKSTLARALAPRLGLPLFDRDHYKDAMFDTLGWSDREWSMKVGAASWAVLEAVVDSVIASGTGALLDTNFGPGDRFITELRHRIAAREVRAFDITLFAEPGVLANRIDQRFSAGDRHPGHQGFGSVEDLEDVVANRYTGPLGLGGPALHLDTTSGAPNPDDIATTIRTWLAT